MLPEQVLREMTHRTENELSRALFWVSAYVLSDYWLLDEAPQTLTGQAWRDAMVAKETQKV